MELDVIIIRLILIITLSFLIWLEREYNQQPAWLRTHILIWLGSTLLMILSIKIASLPGNINGDPWRIAAQVVTWIWFIGAWAIMKMWLNTKWLTTAANIWVTSAIWLAVWAWMYALSIIVTILILFNLIVISKIKSKLIKRTRYCNISINFKKNKVSEKKIIKLLYNLPINIITKDLKEDNFEITIKIISKIDRNIDIYEIQKKLHKIENLATISISDHSK